MINSPDLSGKLAIDTKDLNALRQSAKDNSPQALKAAAKQFEALFMNMVMKSMREATPSEGLFDNQQTKMYTTMLDQQISQTMASRGVGLADMLVKQLSNNRNGPTQLPPLDEHGGTEADSSAGMLNPTRLAQLNAFREQMLMQNDNGSDPIADLATKMLQGSGMFEPPVPVAAFKSRAKQTHVREFEDKLMRHAEAASQATGIPAKFMIGQAALESGWGKREIRMADGSPSHNLFGIKAGPGWKGKSVEATTTEYINGVAHTVKQKFRAYDSYADAFKDYGRLLSKNPRYENVIANAHDASSFAQGLQRAGYATDPQYAAKLTKIIKQSLSA